MGCGGPSARRPLSAIDAYVAALSAGKYGVAYELMSTRYRREHTKEEFEQMLKDSPSDVRETISALRTPGAMEVSATMTYDDLKDRLQLVVEGDNWRIAEDPLSFYPQDTPNRALKSFLRALQNQRYDRVMRFVPNEYKKHMTRDQVREEFEKANKKQNDRVIEMLKLNLNNDVQQKGDEARMPFGDKYEVVFRREDGVWKIEDLY